MDIVTYIKRHIEEPINRYLNRPAASLFVWLFAKMPITPNQVTILAMLVGIAAGYFYLNAYIEYCYLCIAASLYLLSQILDCADGQLARLKGMSSELGRVLDGVGDYVVGFAVVGGICVYFYHVRIPFPILTPIAGLVSIMIHIIYYDYIKNRFIMLIKEKREFYIIEYEKTIRMMKENLSVFLKLYLFYINLQKRLFMSEVIEADKIKDFERLYMDEVIKKAMPLISWTGPNSHLLFITFATPFGAWAIFYANLFIIVFGNIYFPIVLLYQKHLDRRFVKRYAGS